MTNKTRKNIISPRKYIQSIVEKVESGVLSKAEAVRRVTTEQVEALLYNQLKLEVKEIQNRLVSKGINASPGAATGKIFFNLEHAISRYKDENAPMIWVCADLKPNEIEGLSLFDGWIVQHSGATSHASIIARQKKIPCITGINNIKIQESEYKIIIGNHEFLEGDWVSMDGGSGVVIHGKSTILPEKIINESYLHKLLKWADEFRTLKIYANADTALEAEQSKAYGAEGIGVCRTEHMFLEDKTISLMQQLIISYEIGEHLTLSINETENILIAHLLPIQRREFYKILKVFSESPVIIRLLDMPLDEFFSDEKAFINNAQNCNFLKKDLNEEQIREVLSCIHETNPMFGFRGVRLGMLRPAIYEMQVRAVIEAACELVKENNYNKKSILPMIMIPLISYRKEVETIKKLVDTVALQVMKEQNCIVSYQFGTMIETPRAAIIADQIAEYSQFFSFGTNDLTQLTAGFSRDDAEQRFLLDYINKWGVQENHFQVLDIEGVGFLIQLATAKGKEKRIKMGEYLEVGICGEHGGNEKSIAFCHDIGLDYVSCSPMRILIARLAAAHAVLASET